MLGDHLQEQGGLTKVPSHLLLAASKEVLQHVVVFHAPADDLILALMPDVEVLEGVIVAAPV